MKKMNSKIAFFIMLGIVGLMGAAVIGAVILGDIFLHQQSNKLVELKLDSQVLEAQQISLTQAKKDLLKYSELATIAKQIVPQDKDQARATREIILLADQAGVKISAINFPASTLGQLPAKTSTPPTDTPVAKTVTPTITQVKPVDGIKDLYQLDIIVASDTASPASYPRLIDFLGRLEKNRRTAQVTQISIQPDSKNRTLLNFTLTITLYLKP